MEENANLTPDDRHLSRATRDYGWFAVTLLCIVALVAVKSLT
jgi:hypothetical protein